MHIVKRVLGLLFTPKSEWLVVRDESLTNAQVFLKFLFLIAALPSVGYLLSFWRYGDFALNVRAAIVSYVVLLLAIDFTAYAINQLAPNLGSTKNLNSALKLIGFAASPLMVMGVLIFIPLVGTVAWFVGAAYSVYLLYVGLPILMETAQDNLIPFTATSFVIFIVIYLVLALIGEYIFGVRVMGGIF